MTKAEYIERYGIEWYETHKALWNARAKERYNNDIEYRETIKNKCNTIRKRRHKELYNKDEEYTLNHRLERMHRYCRAGEYELIENYELAKADNFKDWCIHHRLELTLNGEYAHSTEELKRMNMYYNRPYFELIFLTRKEHNKLHKTKPHKKQGDK